MSSASASTCPRCGAAASGHFCANCGSPLGNRPCGSCGTSLAPDAKFCHKCGAASGAAAPAGGVRAGMPAGMAQAPAGAAANRTPWIIAAALTLVTIAAIAYSAKGKNAAAPPDMANSGNAAAGGDATGAAGSLGKAPDISQMTPREQFSRLEGRVTAAAEKGDTATVINFTPMALGAYANLPPGDRDIDARYHAAMLQAQVGMFPGALALADTINTESKNNLMATYIRIMVAEYQGDSTKAKAERAKFRDNYDAEMKSKRPEYVDHQPFLDNYRKNAGAK